MKVFMKKRTIFSILQLASYILLTASCANDNTTQSETQKENITPAGSVMFSGSPQPSTRTVILNHTKSSGAVVNWSNSDRIWVQDDANTWQQSAAVTFLRPSDKSKGTFTLSGTYSGTTHSVVYTNKTISGTQPQVEIKSVQTQTAPNKFEHAGDCGDCGIASATKFGSDYLFSLSHKASYLCFIPRSSNSYVNRSKLMKIEIISEDDIAGTYNIASDGTLTLASGGSKPITLSTGSGFALDNASNDMDKNATYVVIAPGTHRLRIRYWLRNTVDNPDGTIDGTVTKYVTLALAPGSIHDVTANLDPHDYSGDNCYMWDAQQQYWHGYEWTHNIPTWQPTVRGMSSTFYAKNNSDNRWYHEHLVPGRFDATQSCTIAPNANEIAWYALNGDPRWDADELWTTMGHLYKGGTWFKKKANITGFSTEQAPDGIDWRTVDKSITNNTLTSGIPSTSELSKYFYLPASGYYLNGKLLITGLAGVHWSSSGSPGNFIAAYTISFSDTGVSIYSTPAGHHGARVQAFE